MQVELILSNPFEKVILVWKFNNNTEKISYAQKHSEKSLHKLSQASINQMIFKSTLTQSYN